MLYKTLIVALSVAAFSSCTTAYRSTQTPDDVYYSPSRPYEERIDRDDRQEELTDNYAEDRQIMMGIRDRRWRYMDDPFAYNGGYYGGGFGNSISIGFYNTYNPFSYGYFNSPYNYGYNGFGYNGWNNYGYGYWNSYGSYNPYFYPHHAYPVITRYQPVNTTPRRTNLNGYNRSNVPGRYNNSNNTINTNRSTNAGRRYNNSNNNSNSGSRVGNAVRRVLTPSSNNSSNNRTYSSPSNNSSSSERSSSSGSSNSGSISRPSRGR